MLFGVSGCTELEGEGDSAIAEITVTPSSFATDLEGGEQVLAVTCNGTWTVSCDQTDVTVEPLSGTGNGSVTVTVPAVETAREFKIVFDAQKQTSVPALGTSTTTTAQAEVAVSQNATGTDQNNYLFYEDCGDDVEKVNGNWPYIDQYTNWGKQGSAATNVTYSGENASVRASGNNYQPTEEAVGLTGQPYVFLNKVPTEAYFTIENIAITGGSNYIFTYNVSCQNGYSGTPSFATVNNDLVLLEFGYDGETWDAVDCTFVENGGNGWYAATAEFKVAADATTLYVRVSYDQGGGSTNNTGARLDDFKLVEGGTGVELAPAPRVYTEATIADIANWGWYSVKNAWVVATYDRGCLLTDDGGKYILAFDPTVNPAVGTKLEISGGVAAYAGLLQFVEGSTITATDETVEVTYPTPETLDAAKVDALVGAIEVKYVEYEGTLSISSGKYYNVTITGTTNQGSIQYPAEELKTTLTALDGKYVKVTGYTIGASSSKYLNTMATSVVETTATEPETPDTPVTPTVKNLPYEESFAASQGDFTFNDVTLPEGSTYVWKWTSYNNEGYMQGSAYVGGAKASESWLVSPEINLNGATAPELTFTHLVNYAYGAAFADLLTLWVKEATATDWAQLTIPAHGTGSNWNWVESGAIDLSAYVGKSVNIAFKYTSNTTTATTWRIKNFKVAEKSATVEPEPEPEPEITETISGLSHIENLDGVTAGKYYFAAYSTKNSTEEVFTKFPYHLWTGTVTSGKADTANYAFADGVLSRDPKHTSAAPETEVAVEAELVAVEGKTNVYYIKFNNSYLSVSAYTANHKLVMSETALEWTAVEHTDGVVFQATDGTNSVTLCTGIAANDLLRQYKTSSFNSSISSNQPYNGVHLFKKN